MLRTLHGMSVALWSCWLLSFGALVFGSEPVEQAMPSIEDVRRLLVQRKYGDVFGPVGRIKLLDDASVQHGLALTQKQLDALSKLSTKTQAIDREVLLKARANPARVSEERARRRLEPLVRSLQSQLREFDEQLVVVLSSAQREKLIGFQMFLCGPRGLADQELKLLFSLSEEQADRLLVLLREHDGKLNELGATGTDAFLQRMELEDALGHRIKAVMSSKQQSAYRRLLSLGSQFHADLLSRSSR